MASLFDQNEPEVFGSVPLAYLLRPKSLEEFFGHEEIVGQGKLLRQLILEDNLHSILLWGPPGCGKTTLAMIVAEQTKAAFVSISAVSSGIPEVKKVIADARERKRMSQRTVLFVDEIHRFNKAQQDALLPIVEDGTVILVGATTENPSFEVISALLSRSQVFMLKGLTEPALKKILERGVEKVAILTGKNPLKFDEEAIDYLVGFANGDARGLLNNLEIILKLVKSEQVSLEDVQKVLQRKHLRYDKKGEEHYNIISALHKSMRDSDPDGALYWMVRMLEGGEDPLYIARRLVRFASEDIGMADPNALQQCIAVQQACHFVGMPECGVNLAQAVVYLSMAPKSNSLYSAYKSIQSDIAKYGNLEVPMHIRNAPTKMMKEFGYGKGYQYAHNFAGAVVNQQHLPDEIKARHYYEPTDRGIELRLKEKLDKSRAKSPKVL